MQAQIPFIDFSIQYKGIRDEVRTAVDAVFESQQFIKKDHKNLIFRLVYVYIDLKPCAIDCP